MEGDLRDAQAEKGREDEERRRQAPFGMFVHLIGGPCRDGETQSEAETGEEAEDVEAGERVCQACGQGEERPTDKPAVKTGNLPTVSERGPPPTGPSASAKTYIDTGRMDWVVVTPNSASS